MLSPKTTLPKIVERRDRTGLRSKGFQLWASLFPLAFVACSSSDSNGSNHDPVADSAADGSAVDGANGADGALDGAVTDTTVVDSHDVDGGKPDTNSDVEESDSGGHDDGGVQEPVVPGARLPITYDLSSLSGTIRFVATDGSDNADGSLSAPYATLEKAIAASASNDTIVIRGGTYRQGQLKVFSNKTITIIAYPGEIPVFNGARPVTSGWTSEGAYKYIAYTPMPVTNGSGICFTTGTGCSTGGQNLSGDGVGKHPDQAWIAQKTLQQVVNKSALATGKFYVDQDNKRLYLIAADAEQSDIEVSDLNVFMSLQAPNSTLRGLRITRFSNGAADYGVINILETADHSLLEDIEISSSAFISLLYQGSANLNEGAILRHATIKDSNWMGVGATYTDDLTLDAVDISGMNPFGEFTYSPQSGALKTSRTRRTKILRSHIHDNRSHGLWFDQSNMTVDVAHCRIIDNAGSGVFYEISDDFLLVDSLIRGGDRPVKLAGSSGLKLVNNTIVGGNDPLGIYTDNRSMPGCADPSQPLCDGSYSSDRDSVRPFPITMDWMPRLDLMLNNIIAYPTGSGYCGGPTSLCITLKNASATVSLESVLHQADGKRGIPQTRMDGNVYANGTGTIIAATSKYTTVSAFRTAMAGPPVSIAGLEEAGRNGNEWLETDATPSAALVADEAVSIPDDARINAYLPAGTKHFGTSMKP